MERNSRQRGQLKVPELECVLLPKGAMWLKQIIERNSKRQGEGQARGWITRYLLGMMMKSLDFVLQVMGSQEE